MMSIEMCGRGEVWRPVAMFEVVMARCRSQRGRIGRDRAARR